MADGTISTIAVDAQAAVSGRRASDRNERKALALGMPFGTACNRLRKSIMFMLAQKAGMDVCHRCENKIERFEELSIDHKDAWEGTSDPVRLFFDLENISFSHLSCNVGAGRRPTKRHSSLKEGIAARNARNQAARVISRRRWRARRRERGLPYT